MGDSIRTTMDAPLLMTPGPCPVFPEVYEACSWKLLHHRTPEFSEYLIRSIDNLKKIFETKQEVFLLTSSGTGGMEAAIANTVSPGDKVLCVSIGVFGNRFHKIAKIYGGKTELLEIPWGKGARPEEVQKAVQKYKPDITTITFNETSTGVTNPIGEIAELVKDETTLLVDAISGLGGVKYEHDKWGVGISIAGTQKALAVPPGLATVAVSDFMWERIENCKSPRFYFDLSAYKKKFESTQQTPYTPAIGLIYGLDVALQKILKIGLENVYSRQIKISEAVQAGVKALGLNFFAEDAYRSEVLTSFTCDIDTNTIRKTMQEKYNIMVAGGQKDLKGKIIRIGHMGAVTNENIYYTLDSLKKSLEEHGHKSKGDPAQAAKEILE